MKILYASECIEKKAEQKSRIKFQILKKKNTFGDITRNLHKKIAFEIAMQMHVLHKHNNINQFFVVICFSSLFNVLHKFLSHIAIAHLKNYTKL